MTQHVVGHALTCALIRSRSAVRREEAHQEAAERARRRQCHGCTMLVFAGATRRTRSPRSLPSSIAAPAPPMAHPQRHPRPVCSRFLCTLCTSALVNRERSQSGAPSACMHFSTSSTSRGAKGQFACFVWLTMRMCCTKLARCTGGQGGMVTGARTRSGVCRRLGLGCFAQRVLFLARDGVGSCLPAALLLVSNIQIKVV